MKGDICMRMENMNIQNITEVLYEKLNDANDPELLTLIIHLHTEYWINKIIQAKSPIYKEILDNNRYTFSIKLDLIYNMGLIPEGLYKNIKKLNSLRNKYAHEINYDFTKADLNYDLSKLVIESKDGIKKYNDGQISSVNNFKTVKEKLIVIATATYGWIYLHANEILGNQIGFEVKDN
jgi:uncharacterized protein YlaN (UPF0358 family)